jgi:hypothetical protein
MNRIWKNILMWDLEPAAALIVPFGTLHHKGAVHTQINANNKIGICFF